MPVKLLFITSLYFYKPTQDALIRMNLPCETKVVPYRNFSEIPTVYLQNAEPYDACFISGASAKNTLEFALPGITKPIVVYQVSSDALHRDILRLAVEKQSLDFSRIAIDFLIPLGSGCMVTDYLALEDMSYVGQKTYEWMQTAEGRPTESVEVYIMRRIQELWAQKAFDLVICQYSSIIPTLQELGIPYRCPFLADSHLRQLIEETLLRLELMQHHSNHPAIVQVFPRQTQQEEKDMQLRTLYEKMQQFIHSNLIDCVLQDGKNCCVMITSMQVLRFLTNDFQICQISSWLAESLSFPVAVGYGIGTNVSHAMNNVQIASKEAKLLGKSFVVDTNGTLIGPLNSKARMVISPVSMPDVSEIAKRCSLSAMTIHKLLTILKRRGSDKITTQELAQQLETTVRNANRIMLNLCRGNVATPVYTQTSHSKGRPIQVYHIDFGIEKL